MPSLPRDAVYMPCPVARDIDFFFSINAFFLSIEEVSKKKAIAWTPSKCPGDHRFGAGGSGFRVKAEKEVSDQDVFAAWTADLRRRKLYHMNRAHLVAAHRLHRLAFETLRNWVRDTHFS